MKPLKTIEKNVERLDLISNILKDLNTSQSPKKSKTINHSLQYDYYMEFIGLYEDTRQFLSEIPADDDNLIEIQHYSKRLDDYWNNYTLN